MRRADAERLRTDPDRSGHHAAAASPVVGTGMIAVPSMVSVAVSAIAVMAAAAMMRAAIVMIPVPDEVQQSRLVRGLRARRNCCGKRGRGAAPRENEGGCQQGLFHLISSRYYGHDDVLHHNANHRTALTFRRCGDVSRSRGYDERDTRNARCANTPHAIGRTAPVLSRFRVCQSANDATPSISISIFGSGSACTTQVVRAG